MSGIDKNKAMEAADSLLRGEGLNHSSFCRALDINPKHLKAKNAVKPLYDEMLQLFGDAIEKQGFDWFIAKSDEKKAEEAAKASEVESVKRTEPEPQPEAWKVKSLEGENDRLKKEVAGLKAELAKQVGVEVKEPLTCIYHKDFPDGRTVKKSEADKLLKEGWVDHPDDI